MAEALLRQELKRRKIRWWSASSCGINAEINGSLSENSKIALFEQGIELLNFKPKQLTKKLIETSELVITMTSSQKQLLERFCNVFCISDVCGYEIPDPYGRNLSQYTQTCKVLKEACHILIENYILKQGE